MDNYTFILNNKNHILSIGDKIKYYDPIYDKIFEDIIDKLSIKNNNLDISFKDNSGTILKNIIFNVTTNEIYFPQKEKHKFEFGSIVKYNNIKYKVLWFTIKNNIPYYSIIPIKKAYNKNSKLNMSLELVAENKLRLEY